MSEQTNNTEATEQETVITVTDQPAKEVKKGIILKGINLAKKHPVLTVVGAVTLTTLVVGTVAIVKSKQDEDQEFEDVQEAEFEEINETEIEDEE